VNGQLNLGHQAKYASRTSHEGLGSGDRQEVSARLPVRPPAEALQRSAHQRRSVIPPRQGQAVTPMCTRASSSTDAVTGKTINGSRTEWLKWIQ